MSSKSITTCVCIILLINLTSAVNEYATAKSTRNGTASVSRFRIGQSEVPDDRPAVEDRLFKSQTVEAVILNVGARIKDDTIRTIFANCLPSTLDTTVLFHRPSINDTIPYTYIITGDIKAMWLRDSTYQVNPYVPMAKDDAQLRQLILGVINTQAEMLKLYPWGNAYFPLKHWNSGIELKPSDWGKDDNVSPKYNDDEVFEAKYELDSLASFLYLSKYFYEETGNADFVNNLYWVDAVEIVLKSMREQQGGTIEVIENPPFKFTRPTVTQTETVNLYGIGNPVKRCGLIRSFFRPSDDSTILQYLIPSNAMAVVGLKGVANVLTSVGMYPDLSQKLRDLAVEVESAIGKYGIVSHPEFGRVYAYEVDCYGSHIFMDDANFPSLLSLPKFGFVEKDDEIYLNTRKYILSPEWNPYFFEGKYSGIGSPHTGLLKVWHMAQAMQGMTSNNETEIYNILWMLRNTTAGTGFMHEGYDVNNDDDFSRAWFAWANTVFGDFIIHLDKEHPHLLQGPPADPPVGNGSNEIGLHSNKMVLCLFFYLLIVIL
ncbi:Meiotically up-regulated gene 157 protein [Pseudolycoriella hygida]|uniref:Meiotically up-regulated gene 157 protein n=1 Tax=Pseudolycoriella hygida TaxID=35572 RepID=A0A9Q0MSF6_9DIPT|nr:Meiotically up-regulated gene 157 protein [Pseudolycoriella hygida]